MGLEVVTEGPKGVAAMSATLSISSSHGNAMVVTTVLTAMDFDLQMKTTVITRVKAGFARAADLDGGSRVNNQRVNNQLLGAFGSQIFMARTISPLE